MQKPSWVRSCYLEVQLGQDDAMLNEGSAFHTILTQVDCILSN